MYRFLEIFSRKIESHRTTQTPYFRTFFLKNAIKHQFLRSDRTRHSAKIMEDPLKIPLMSTIISRYKMFIFGSIHSGCKYLGKGSSFQKYNNNAVFQSHFCFPIVTISIVMAPISNTSVLNASILN